MQHMKVMQAGSDAFPSIPYKYWCPPMRSTLMKSTPTKSTPNRSLAQLLLNQFPMKSTPILLGAYLNFT